MSRPSMIAFVAYNGDQVIPMMLPSHRIVCPRCEGEGRHVNPAVDGDGLTEEQLSDPDFREGYKSGRYDVTCEICKGDRVVEEVDEDSLTDEQRKILDQHYAEEAESRKAEQSEKAWIC